MNFLNMLKQGDKFLRLVAYSCIAVLIVVQFFFLNDKTRRFFSYIDRLEGENVSSNMPLYPFKPLAISHSSDTPALQSLRRESKVITVRMIQPRQSEIVSITINGQISGDFRTGDTKITVYNGDYLEIDASKLFEKAQFVVSVSNPGIMYPEDGAVFETVQSVVSIGKVKFK